MGEITEQKAFVGKASFYHKLDERTHPRFLQRNLNSVFDAHERRLDGNATSDVEEGHCLELFMRPESESRKMLEAAFKGQRPFLSVTGLKLRRKTHERAAKSKVTSSRATNEDGDPDWLPREDESRISCQITVAVTHPRQRHPCYLDSIRSNIIGRGRGTRNPTFDIVLQKPFQISVDRFALSAKEDEDLKDYQLEVGIHCTDSDDTTELLSQIEGKSKDDSDRKNSEGIIFVAWDGLPDLPQPGTLLPLQRGHGKKKIELPFGAEVCMSWNEPTPAFVTCTKALRQERRTRLQLPTPVSDDLERPSNRIAIKYYFRVAFQTRTVDRRDLSCVLCERRIAHSSFERLRLHYLTHHDHLHFEACDDPDNPNGKIIRVTSPDQKPPAHEPLQVRPEAQAEAWEWQAPEEAFDIATHLDDNTTWTHPTLRPTKAAAQKGKQKLGKSPVKAAMAPTKVVKRQLRPPEEVPDLPTKRIRKHRVPNVPGISFYRTTSKQILEPGTELSDSDEEPDESWMEMSQRQRLMDLGEDDIAIDFHELFNRHLSEERPMSDRLTRDAIVRFTRRFRSKLSNPIWADKFRKKLEQLESRKIIGRDVVEYCDKHIKYAGEGLWREDAAMPGAEKPGHNDSRDSNEDKPFGHWKILCIKSEDPKLPVIEFPMTALLNDDKPIDEITPNDISWNKLCHLLERDCPPFEVIMGKTHDMRISLMSVRHPDGRSEGAFLGLLESAKRGPVVLELFSRSGYKEDFERERAEQLRQEAKEKEVVVPVSTKGRCVCGEKPEGLRKTIVCANVKCVRVFHMGCVGLERRSLEWKCEECK